jgi:hypothetical protein
MRWRTLLAGALLAFLLGVLAFAWISDAVCDSLGAHGLPAGDGCTWWQ